MDLNLVFILQTELCDFSYHLFLFYHFFPKWIHLQLYHGKQKGGSLGDGIVSLSSPEKSPLSKEHGILGIPWCSSGWDSRLPQQGTQVQCLVEEIRSQKPYGIGKKFKKKFYIKYIESLAF